MTVTVARGLIAGILVLATCAPPSRPIVAEVYYDATGDDTGWEFVELFNPLERAVSLAGVKLQAGDGAGPGRWTTRWTGSAQDTIRPGARFVIGGARVSPAPGALVTLDLQNGPDGMRLLWADGTSETVGWGALAYAEYFCGAPAPDVPAGRSLARVPDDADLGSNALDFRAAEPSPGRANQPSVDLAAEPGSLEIAPAQPEPGEALQVTLRIVNRGALPFAEGATFLVLAGDAMAESLDVALQALAPGETLRVAQAARAGAAGRRTLIARARAPGDAAEQNDADTLGVRVGPGPLEITEIQFHPAAGEGEWIEVRNRSGVPLALAGFTLSDRGETRTRVVDAVEVAADSLALLAQTRAALLAFYPGLDPSRVASVAALPSLNNSDDDGGIADIVTLRESDGLPADRVAYSAAGVPAGVPLEKDAGRWRPSTSPLGTPLAPPLAPATYAAGFAVSPRRVSSESPEVELSWQLPWQQAHVSVELYDMAGRRVTRLLDDAASAAAGTRRVRLDGAGPGVYVAILRARSERAQLTRTALLRIAGARP
jgi:hypothetical protein